VPRKNIKIKEKLEYLSILNGKGKLDEALDPKLDADLSLHVYRLMVTSRRVDERMINMQRQGRIGTYGPCRGQEACFCGATPVMQKDDWIVHAFREVGSFVHRGWPIEKIPQFWGGYEEGATPPEGVNDLPIAVPIGTQCQHAMGLALAIRIKGHDRVVLCYCGDGGTSEGDFHEAMNFAGVYNLPLVMFVENNQWAISIPREKQTASATIAQKAIAYGFDGIQVDGNDVLACYVATKDAVDKARAGGGPTLIEGVTYRLGVHTTADDPKKYRSDEEVAEWEKLDPIPRYEGYLKSRGLLNDKLKEEIEAQVEKEVAAAVDRYEAGRDVDPVDCFRYVYANMPDELVEQMKEFEAALEREGYRPGH
jgi:pyruvate dehydrogenase E1 component alpha subunit